LGYSASDIIGTLFKVEREGGREGGREGWVEECEIGRLLFMEGGREGGREGRH